MDPNCPAKLSLLNVKFHNKYHIAQRNLSPTERFTNSIFWFPESVPSGDVKITVKKYFIDIKLLFKLLLLETRCVSSCLGIHGKGLISNSRVDC